MKFITILDELANESTSLKHKLDSIPPKNKKTDKAIIESLTKLAFILYVIEDMKNAVLVTDKLATISFGNDYDYWTWIEYAVSLRAELAEIDGQFNKINNSVEIIKNALNAGEGLHKKIRNNVHSRFMSGENVELDESVISGENKNITDVFDLRLVYLMKLVKIKILGGSNEYPVQRAVENIRSDVHEMKLLLVDGFFKNVRPFK